MLFQEFRLMSRKLHKFVINLKKKIPFNFPGRVKHLSANLEEYFGENFRLNSG